MDRRPTLATRRIRTRLAALGLAALLAVAPAALAAPRHSVEGAGQLSTISSWFTTVAGGLSAVWQQIVNAFGGGQPGGGDGVPGTGIDPDGHHARNR